MAIIPIKGNRKSDNPASHSNPVCGTTNDLFTTFTIISFSPHLRGYDTHFTQLISTVFHTQS